jgi:hypothetical protein
MIGIFSADNLQDRGTRAEPASVFAQNYVNRNARIGNIRLNRSLIGSGNAGCRGGMYQRVKISLYGRLRDNKS